ncbi:hypothetical protein [Thermus filiformis]|uniref:hypothetical protein n=1 Tax=Thermus filiformis TaxID=276 RepID=UPI000A9B8BB8|nr:hypothetical protein [Thermus filiformis]
MRWISEELVDFESLQEALEEVLEEYKRAILALLEEAQTRFFDVLREREKDRELLLRFGSLDEDDAT